MAGSQCDVRTCRVDGVVVGVRGGLRRNAYKLQLQGLVSGLCGVEKACDWGCMH